MIPRVSRLSDAELFVAVVDAGGFSAAARRLGKTQPVVSRQLAALERRLGARLLDRTTRRMRATPAGTRFYESCAEVLRGLREAEDAVADATSSPRGWLRLSAPPTFARAHLAPLLPDFAAAFPQVGVEMLLVDRYVDVVAEGFDLVVRLGPLRPSSLTCCRLTTGRYVLCASPAYVRRHGAPRAVEDLRSAPPGVDVFVLFPSARYMPRRVRAFVDLLAERLASAGSAPAPRRALRTGCAPARASARRGR